MPVRASRVASRAGLGREVGDARLEDREIGQPAQRPLDRGAAAGT